MKHKMVILGLGVAAAGTLSSCGGENGPAPAPAPAATTQSLDTQQVLAQAKVTSETADPYQADFGYVVLTDTSETTDAAGINGT